jgi:CDP-glucose 4,6-dehydratase
MSSFWQGRPVLVTGASGLLGSYMVPQLFRRGAEVVALVRDSLPGSILVRDGWLDRITSVRGSVTDASLLRRTVAEYSIRTIFHLGAQTLVGVAQTDPVGTLEANVCGTWNVLDAARQAGAPQVLIASSDKAYGISEQMPYREDYPLRGAAPYEVSKSCADLIGTMYGKSYDLPVAIARCGNLFGGGDLNFSRLIPGLIQATLRDERFTIRSDGKYVRDFLYVEDAVDGYLCLAEGLAKGSVSYGEAFNFGLELRLQVIDLVEKILRLMGASDLRPIIQDAARTEIREQYLDSSKARYILGWFPRFGVDEGLHLTIDWYKDFLSNGIRVKSVVGQR